MRRLDIIIGTGLFLAFVTAALIGLLVWQQSRFDTALTSAADDFVYTAPDASLVEAKFPGQSALIAFAKAQRRALAWQPDSMLVTGSATWLRLSSPAELREGQASWAFTFYSPIAGSAVTYTVVTDSVTESRPRAVRTPLDPLQLGGWQLDSTDASQLFLQNGGDAFLTSEDSVTLTANLTMVADSRRVEWVWAGFGDRSGRSISMILDATSGELLDVQAVTPEQ